MEHDLNQLPLHTTFYLPNGHWIGRIIEDDGERYIACYGAKHQDPCECLPENEVRRMRQTDDAYLAHIDIIEQASAMRHDTRIPFITNIPTPDLTPPSLDFTLDFAEDVRRGITTASINDRPIGKYRRLSDFYVRDMVCVFTPYGQHAPKASEMTTSETSQDAWSRQLKRHLAENHARAVEREDLVQALIEDYVLLKQPTSRAAVAKLIERTLIEQRDLLHLQNVIARAER